MLTKSMQLIGLGCGMLSGPLAAISLDAINSGSYIDEPLSATIVLQGADAQDADTVFVRPVSRAEAVRLGLEQDGYVSDLFTEIRRSESGELVLHIGTRTPVHKAVLNFALLAESKEGRVLQKYSLLLDEPPEAEVSMTADNKYKKAQDELELLETESNGEDAVWDVDVNVAERHVWQVEENQSLSEIAISLRPSNTVSVEQMMFSLLQTNPEAFENGNANTLKEGAVLKIPGMEELRKVDRAEASLVLEKQFQEWQKKELAKIPSFAAEEKVADEITVKGVLRLGNGEAPLSQAANEARPAAEAKPGTTKAASVPVEKVQLEKVQQGPYNRSSDLERRLENALARLSDANDLITSHMNDIDELNLLVEDLKHTIELKNSELASVQARALGATVTKEMASLKSNTVVVEDADATIDISGAEIQKSEGTQADAEEKTSLLSSIAAVLAAIFAALTFAGWRAARAERSRLRKEEKQAQAALAAESAQDETTEIAEGAEGIVAKADTESESGAGPAKESDGMECKPAVSQPKEIIAEAEVLSSFGKHTEAIAHLQKALDTQPEQAELISALRETYILAGEFDEAAKLFSEVESANDIAYAEQAFTEEQAAEEYDEFAPPVWTPPVEKPSQQIETAKPAPAQPLKDAEQESGPKQEKAAKKPALNARQAKKARNKKADAQNENKKAQKKTRLSRKEKRAQKAREAQANKLAEQPVKEKPVAVAESKSPETKNTEAKAAAANDSSRTEKSEPVAQAAASKPTERVDSGLLFGGEMSSVVEVEATPLELVQAYIELEDHDAARQMLEDILGKGNPNEKARAKAMLAEIS